MHSSCFKTICFEVAFALRLRKAQLLAVGCALNHPIIIKGTQIKYGSHRSCVAKSDHREKFPRALNKWSVITNERFDPPRHGPALR